MERDEERTQSNIQHWGHSHIQELTSKKKKKAQKFLASKIAILHFITLSLKTQSSMDQTIKLTKSPNYLTFHNYEIVIIA